MSRASPCSCNDRPGGATGYRAVPARCLRYSFAWSAEDLRAEVIRGLSFRCLATAISHRKWGLTLGSRLQMLRELTRHRCACVEAHRHVCVLVGSILVGNETATGGQNDARSEVAGHTHLATFVEDPPETRRGGQPRPLATKVL